MLKNTDSKTKEAETFRQVAQIHVASIHQGFLSTLGVGFLALLYESIESDPKSILYVEKKNGKVVGFVAGGRGMRSIYREMLKRFPRLILTLAPALLSPLKLKRILEIVWYGRKNRRTFDFSRAELFSIAVSESSRGKGVAKRLYHLLAQKFVQDGEKAFCIVVGDSLYSAHRFYKRMGAAPITEISVHQGEVSTIYKQDLPILD